MKTIFKLLISSIFVALISACSDLGGIGSNANSAQYGEAYFAFSNGSAQDDSSSFASKSMPLETRSTEVQPKYVKFSLLNIGTSVSSTHTININSFGSSYITQPISLIIGEYQITSFIIYDNSDRAIYATPLKDSKLAPLVKRPLPYHFNLAVNDAKTMTMEVLKVEATSAPEDFGYVGFNWIIVNKADINFKILGLVSDVPSPYYTNIQTKLTVKGTSTTYLSQTEYSTQNYTVIYSDKETELFLDISYKYSTEGKNYVGVTTKKFTQAQLHQSSTVIMISLEASDILFKADFSPQSKQQWLAHFIDDSRDRPNWQYTSDAFSTNTPFISQELITDSSPTTNTYYALKAVIPDAGNNQIFIYTSQSITLPDSFSISYDFLEKGTQSGANAVYILSTLPTQSIFSVEYFISIGTDSADGNEINIYADDVRVFTRGSFIGRNKYYNGVWHNMIIEATSSTLTWKIDNVTVYTQANTLPKSAKVYPSINFGNPYWKHSNKDAKVRNFMIRKLN